MLKVNPVNYRLLFASVALLTLSAAACTRDKPTSPLPTPTLVALDASALATPTFAPLASPGIITPLAFSTPATTETPGGPPLPPTSQPPSTIVSVPTTIPIASPQSPSAVNPGTYTVQLGDWLNKIANQFCVSAQAILAANPGVNANFIYPGQVLKIPAANAPAQNPAATVPAPVAGLPSTYTVQRGDWLYAIARKFGVSVAALQNANPGINFNVLTPGMVLRIPGGAPSPSTSATPAAANPNSYTVKAGDTLFSIAVRFGTTTYALQIANNLSNPNFVYVGQVLVLPK